MKKTKLWIAMVLTCLVLAVLLPAETKASEAAANNEQIIRVDNGVTLAIRSLEGLAKNSDGVYVTPQNGTIYLAIDYAIEWCGGNTLKDYVDAYGEAYFALETWQSLVDRMDEDGLIPMTDEAIELFLPVITGNPAWGETDADLVRYMVYDFYFDGNYPTSGTCGENLTWTLSVDGTLTISGEGEMETSALLYKSFNKQIIRVVIGDGVTAIGDWAFSDCTTLTSVVIGDGVTAIGDRAFSDCTALTSVDIGDSVTTIGNFAFDNCSALTSVVIPDSVTTISNYAFVSCAALASAVIGDSVETIAESAFNACPALATITVSENNAHYSSKDGVLFDKDQTTLIRYPASKVGAAYQIPDGVTAICDRAFFRCDALISIVIPDSVTTIGYEAFCSCDALTCIVIPDSVETIGYEAFYDCAALTSVVIGDSVTTIGDYAFSECTALTSVVIGDSVTTIGNFAFACSYSSALTTVCYTGSEDEWNAINFEIGNDNLRNAEIVFNWVLLSGLNKDSDGVWRYYENGFVATDFTGFVKHINGKYYFVNKGVVKKSTGFVKHVNGKYYYIQGGVKTAINGFVKHTNGKYYYVQNGMMVDTTGLVKHTNGKYYYVLKGQMQNSFTGLAKHTNKKFYYVEKGIWVKVTALVPHINGKLYYVVGGIYDNTYNGTAKDLNGKEYKVVGGIAQP